MNTNETKHTHGPHHTRELFDIYSVRLDTGERTKVNVYAMSHKEACTFKSKMTEFDHRRIEIEANKRK
jgi:hypothetical protein